MSSSDPHHARHGAYTVVTDLSTFEAWELAFLRLRDTEREYARELTGDASADLQVKYLLIEQLRREASRLFQRTQLETLGSYLMNEMGRRANATADPDG